MAHGHGHVAPDADTYVSDATGALTGILEKGATSLVTVGYDSADRRSSMTRGGASFTTGYGYDTISRLSSLTQDLAGSANDETLTLSYNPASQITNRTSNNASYAFGVSSLNRNYGVNSLNQLTSAGSQSLGYDGRGNLNFDGATTYTYDRANRLNGTSAGAAFAYDPFDRLYQITSSGGTVTRLLYERDHIIGEYNATSGLLRRYVHGFGADEPLLWYESASTSPPSTSRKWLAADNQGSIIAVTDSTGASIATNTYDEYGVPGSGNLGRFQYTGQATLSEVAMGDYYYKARIYSANLGRFLQTDPVGYDAGPNMYAYVENDPTNKADPLGLSGRAPGLDPPVVPLEGVEVIARKLDSVLPATFSWASSSNQPTSMPAGNKPQTGNKPQDACAAGKTAAGISNALSGGGTAHDAMKTMAERIAGKAAGRAFVPLSVGLQSGGAVATLTASIQRGEPIDVAVARAALPAGGSFVGGAGGGFAGAVAGGAAGTVVPVLGNGVGAIAGGISGTIGGSIAGEKGGDWAADQYAKARGFGGC